MNNKKRYWLRGGLIGWGVGFISFWIAMLGASNLRTGVFKCSQLIDNAWCAGGLSEFLLSPLHWIGSLFIWGIPIAIIGNIIGFIYGKIKNRDKKTR